MTNNTAGFYKRDQLQLLYSSDLVQGPTYSLFAHEQATYTYPVDGWSWYADETQARAALGLPPVDSSQS